MDEQQFRLGFHFCQERWRRKPRPVITRMLHWTETVTIIGRCRVSGRGGSELGMSASGNRWLATAKNSCGSFLKLSWSRNLNPEVRVYSSGSQQVDDEDAKLIDFLRRETTEQRTAKNSPHQWALSMGFAVRPSFLPKSNQFIKSLLGNGFFSKKLESDLLLSFLQFCLERRRFVSDDIHTRTLPPLPSIRLTRASDAKRWCSGIFKVAGFYPFTLSRE
ncbi:unnamed protein product [Arabidopsis thaliana]|uniref:Uncharacterized protein n=1 Tax=Arabidopsis thaliana TaxID=3702 RepID=A0A5S9WV45_ARATH|nr:unnamed protein product [Arabidopsis thaliana]